MRNVKLVAAALTLALTSVVYAGRVQEAAKTQDAAKAAPSCCKAHGGAQGAAAHAGMKHDGEGCCGAGCCGDTCDLKHDAHAGAPKTSASGEKGGCCSGGSCCCAGDSCETTHQGAQTKAAAHPGEGCCKDGAACCKGGGQACCKAHQSEAVRAAAQTPGGKGEGYCGSCACCGAKAGHAGGR